MQNILINIVVVIVTVLITRFIVINTFKITNIVGKINGCSTVTVEIGGTTFDYHFEE